MTLRRSVLLLAAAIGGGTLGGCAAALTRDGIDPGKRSEVTKVVCFYDTNPFRSFDAAGDRNVEGFEVKVSLFSGKRGRGIAEDGVIRLKMYRLDRDRRGKVLRTFVIEWAVDTADLPLAASPLFGKGYVLKLTWAPSNNVLGHEVQIVTTFETRSGRIIQGQTKSMRVPRAEE